jgi:hypothetical protein
MRTNPRGDGPPSGTLGPQKKGPPGLQTQWCARQIEYTTLLVFMDARSTHVILSTKMIPILNSHAATCCRFSLPSDLLGYYK